MQGSMISELGSVLAIIDEDEHSAHWLHATLAAADYRCVSFASYSEAELQIDALGIKAVLLDLASPTSARIEAIRSIRSVSDVPVLVVTAGADERDKVSSLDAGADDYLTKPLTAGEFLARIRVALRHGRARGNPPGGRVRVGELNVDLLAREVTLQGTRLSLTPTDYKLLSLLARNQGRVVPHRRLLQEAWGPNARDPHYLRVYMARLRRKLDPERSGLQYIVTEAGVGYRLLSVPKF
jgi:two-component system, OmpR family, KDP operon response regulator KdpE